MKRPVWLLLLPFAAWLPFLGQFVYAIGADYSDLAITHLPNALYLQRALTTWKQIPLWSNTILSGYPFAANPLSGLWYPFGWPALLFSQPFGLNLMALLHSLWGGYGLYRLMRADGLPELAAAFSGAVWMALPRNVAHLAAGHLTLGFALAWTPWLLLAARCRDQGHPLREGCILGLILLADVRWAVYAGLLWGAYRLRAHFAHSQTRDLGSLRDFTLNTLAQAGLAGGLAAPLLAPLAEYTRLSTRQFLQPADTLFLSLPVGRLLGLLSPSFDGNVEWTVYVGGAVLLAGWVVGHQLLRRQAAFWLIVVVVSMILALGSALPGAATLARLPGVSLLRVPARFVLLAGLGFAALAGYGLASLAQSGPARDPGAFWSRLFTAGISALAVLLAAGSTLMTGKLPWNMLWGSAAILLAAALLFLRDSGRLSPNRSIALFVLLALIDLLGVDGQSVRFRPALAVMSEGEAAIARISADTGLYRVYSPSYSVSQQAAAAAGVELAGGIDPLQLASYAAFLAHAGGVQQAGYSVTQPPLAGDRVDRSNRNAIPDAHLLGWLSVRYMAAGYALKDVDGLDSVAQVGAVYLYRNRYALPRAWVQPPGSAFGEGTQPADTITWTPNRISITASGPGRLVLSELAYPGWWARIDGQPVALQTAGGLFRAVDLPPGTHAVQFAFRPASLYLGLGLCSLALLALILTRKRDRVP